MLWLSHINTLSTYKSTVCSIVTAAASHTHTHRHRINHAWRFVLVETVQSASPSSSHPYWPLWPLPISFSLPDHSVPLSSSCFSTSFFTSVIIFLSLGSFFFFFFAISTQTHLTAAVRAHTDTLKNKNFYMCVFCEATISYTNQPTGTNYNQSNYLLHATLDIKSSV